MGLNMDAESLYFSLLRSKFVEAQKIEREKQKLLASPKKMDELVGGIAQELSPSIKAAKKGKHPTLVDAVEATVQSDHPMKGFATEYRERLKRALAHPDTEGYDVSEISEALTNEMLKRPARPGQGSRLEESYAYKRRADAGWFGLGGEDETVKKLPGQEEYNIAARKMEDEELAEMPWAPTLKGAAQQAGAGAVIGGALGGVFGVGGGAVPGAVAGAAGGAAMELFQPWVKLVATRGGGGTGMA